MYAFSSKIILLEYKNENSIMMYVTRTAFFLMMFLFSSSIVLLIKAVTSTDSCWNIRV